MIRTRTFVIHPIVRCGIADGQLYLTPSTDVGCGSGSEVREIIGQQILCDLAIVLIK